MFYISFNKNELGILLSKTTGDETQLYLALRKFSDFKTGCMTHPAAGRLNHTFIARMLSREARQGVKARTVHRIEVSRQLERLVVLGLVADLGRNGKVLTMRLPLVGMELNTELGRQTTKDKTCEQTAKKSDNLCGHSPTKETIKTATPSDLQGISEIKSKQKPLAKNEIRLSRSCVENFSESAESLMGQGKPAPSPSSLSTQSKESVHPLSVSEGSNSPSAQKTITPSATACREKSEKSETRFRNIVESEGNGIFRYVDSDISQRIYKSWIAIGVTEQQLRAAVKEVISDAGKMPTPDSIDAVLRLLIAPQKLVKARPGKGALVL
jgi:hypothetical protein